MSVLLDETGLHAEDCPCMRCESGWRPTAAGRWRARESLRIRREKEMLPPETKKEKEHRERFEARQRAILAEQKKRTEQERGHVPLTAEQAAELRAAHPEIHNRRASR